MRLVALAVLAALLACSASNVLAQGYKIDWYSINSGGGVVSGGSYKINCTIGQPAAGFVKSGSFLHWIGFWAADVPSPVLPASIAAAKQYPDGIFISLAGRIVTSGPGDFASCFYIEEENRSSGIRVAAAASSVSGLARGSVVNVIGALGTAPNGERQIIGPIVIITGTHAPLEALGMTNKYVGGGDLGNVAAGLGQRGVEGSFGINNIGLLIKTWGRVTDSGTGYVILDDGSGTPVRIDTSILASPPGDGLYVNVIGISSLHGSRPERLLLALP